jgi:hypothetical protein
VDDYKRDHPGHTVPGWMKKGYIEYLEKKLPAFKADYEFSRQPLAARLQTFKPITNSRYSEQWGQLLKLASERASTLEKAGITKTGIADQWTNYDLPVVKEWINGLPIGFRRELARWQKNHPQFLEGLVR